jgi:hypothetical protein
VPAVVTLAHEGNVCVTCAYVVSSRYVPGGSPGCVGEPGAMPRASAS